MKTVNLNNEIKVFHDIETGKYTGFAGCIKLFKKNIYIDTRNGIGYDKTIKELGPYINRLASKYNFTSLGYSFDDTKQHIIMRILEGIPKYNPTRGMKLSAFIYMRVERRLINEIRNSHRDFKNPTTLRTSLFSVKCTCGKKFTISTTGDEVVEQEYCHNCNRTLESAKIYPINKPPESLHTAITIRDRFDETKGDNIEDIISNDSFDIPLVYGEKPKLEDIVIAKRDFESCINLEDTQIKQLVKLVCFEDYSIKDAAKIVGISNTGVSNKFKQLGRKKKIRDMLGR